MGEEAGVFFKVYWVAFRQNGCSSSDDTPDSEFGPSQLIVNQPPLFEILQPDEEGGVDFAATEESNPWDMNDAGDIAETANITGIRIYTDNEKYGVRGDYFCATNEEGNSDPYQTSFKVSHNADNRIDSSVYKNLTVKFYVDREQDVVNGSVLRNIVLNTERDGAGNYLNGDDTFYLGQEWVTITQDMTKIQLEELIHPVEPSPVWGGLFNELRSDVHEFSEATTYCIDYIKLRTDDGIRGGDNFAIAYELSDADSDTVDVSFYFTTTEGATTGGTLIETVDDALNADTRIVEFDTTNVAEGTYYIYAVVDDGLNERRVSATGRLVVDDDWVQDSTDPKSSFDYPEEDSDVYKSTGMVVAGYAIDNVQVALVEVLVDDEYLDSFVPSIFNKTARTLYSTYSDASNSGFWETVSLSGVSTGDRTVTLRVCDTAGNCTTEDRNVVVNNGSDPDPPARGGSDEEQPIPIGESDLAVSYNIYSDTSTLTFTIENPDTCPGTVSVLGGLKKKKLKKLKKYTVLEAFTSDSDAVESVQGQAGYMKGGRTKKGKKRKPVFYLAALCEANSELSPIVKVKASKKKFGTAVGKWGRKQYLNLLAAAMTLQ